MDENLIKVYVKLDSNNIIIDIISDSESSITGESIDRWTQIDKGLGDKYSHAQGNYLDGRLIDLNSRYNYKLVDNKPVKLTDEEKESLFPTPVTQPTTDETLSREIANIKIDNMKKDAVIANALQTIAGLKLEVMNLKGGNA